MDINILQTKSQTTRCHIKWIFVVHATMTTLIIFTSISTKLDTLSSYARGINRWSVIFQTSASP